MLYSKIITVGRDAKYKTLNPKDVLHNHVGKWGLERVQATGEIV